MGKANSCGELFALAAYLDVFPQHIVERWTFDRAFVAAMRF
jgi:hypothetical protein